MEQCFQQVAIAIGPDEDFLLRATQLARRLWDEQFRVPKMAHKSTMWNLGKRGQTQEWH
jgi:hypothetical protein